MNQDEDINAPTVPSGPTTNGHIDTSIPKTKQELLRLMDQRDDLEAELKALGEVLDSHKVTMTTPLTTFDGYPRDDIDVAQIRITRSRIIHLKTDWKALMARIEEGLHLFHSQLKPEDLVTVSTTSASPFVTNGDESAPSAIPFAVVNTVAPSSPAEQAGLKPGDKITVFGGVRGEVGREGLLSRVSNVVQGSEGREVRVEVQRAGESGLEVVRMVLTPRSGWGGRGLLGCHLLPV